MRYFSNFLRPIKKIFLENGLVARFVRWEIEQDSIEDDVDVLFPDGIISINSKSNAWIVDFGAKNYSILTDYGKEIIELYSLKDEDLFIGRKENYFLFRDGNVNVKTKELNIDCDDINVNVANSITVNGVSLTFTGNKMLINGNKVAVVGGVANTTTGIIETSGQ